MKPLYETALQRPRRMIGVAVVITLLAAPGAFWLTLRTDGHALVPENAPEVLLDHEIRTQFGLDDPLVLLIRTVHPDGIFNLATLSTVNNLTEVLTKVEGVRPWTVFSLSTEHNDRVWPGTLRFRKFLEPFPKTREDMLRVRDDLRAIKLYGQTLISRNEQATAVMVGVPPGMLRTDFIGRVRDLVDEIGSGPDRIDIIGAPVAEALLGTHILEDLGVPRFVLKHSTYSEDEQSTGGLPTSLFAWRVWIARHIGLLPIAVGIMAVTFLVCFRSFTAMALPMAEVLAALAFVFGMMGWSGVPVYLTIAVLPIILVVSGVTDEIHLFTRYRTLLAEQSFSWNDNRDGPLPDHIPVVRATLRELVPAIIKTSLTTAVGCLSFAMSPLPAVRAFGIFTAVGVLFCMGWSLLVIPAMLVLIDPRRISPHQPDSIKQPGSEPLFASLLDGLSHFVVRRRVPILVVAFILVCVAPVGVSRIRIQDSWIDGFAPESQFRTATEYFNEQFLGTHLLHVVVRAAPDKPIRWTITAQHMRTKQISLPGAPDVDPASLVGRWIRIWRNDMPTPPGGESTSSDERQARISRIGYEWSAPIEHAARTPEGIDIQCGQRHGSARAALRLYGADEANVEIYSRPMMSPDTLKAIDQFENFLADRTQDAVGGVLGLSTYVKTTNFMARARSETERSIPPDADRIEWIFEQYQRIRGIEHRRQIVSDDYNAGIVTIYMNRANFVDTARLLNATREYARSELEPQGLSISFAGDVAVSQTLIQAIVTTQVRSLLGSILGIVLITGLMGRSLMWGLLSALPCSIAVLMNFAFMGLVNMPFGVATSMFTGMTLGMGIDYAVHLIERYRHSTSVGIAGREALRDALRITGPAVLVDAVAVAFGFGALTLSQVPANERLGTLVILSLVVCLLATFFLIPAILAVADRRRAMSSTNNLADPLIPRSDT